LARSGLNPEAVAEFTNVIELKPDFVDAWRGRADSHLRLGQKDSALADSSKIIELDPKSASAWQYRGSIYLVLGQQDNAIADYTKAVELGPKDAMAHNNLAWVLATHPNPKVRDPGRAVTWAKIAVQLAPKEGVYWNTLGVAHYRAGDWKAALAALKKSMELREGGDSFDWFVLAMSHEKLGEMEKARQWYDRARHWMDENQVHNEELRRFRAEATEVLGVDQKED
jgi:Flp pilus assembly protein TadD